MSIIQSSTKTVICILTLALVLAALPAAAATATWTGGGADANWLTGANWSGGSGTSGAAAANDILSFAGTTQTSPVNNFTADTSFGGINLPNTTAGQSFSLSGNRILLGGNMTTTASSGAGITDTIANDLLINAAATRKVTGASSHTIALTGNLTINTAAGILQLDNYEYAALNGAAGAINFNFAGAGLIYNDFSGVQPATVTLSRAINATTAASLVANSPGVIYNGTFTGSANTFTLQGVSTTSDFQSAISTANCLIQKAQAGNWTLSGLYSSACSGTPITVAGGALTLNNDANTFTGGGTYAAIFSGSSPITLTVTSLKNYSSACALGASASGIILMGTGAGAPAVLNYIGGGDTCNRQIKIGNVVASQGNAMVANNGANGGTGLRLTATAFNTPLAGSTANRMLFLGGANTDANEISGVIADNAASTGLVGLTKTNAGSWKLSGANTYTGGTTINGGILTANRAQVGTTSGPLGASGSIVFGGGTLQFTALSGSWDPSSRIAAGTSTSAVSIDTGGQSITFGTALTASQSGGLMKLGSGTLTLNQTELYTGTTAVNAGTLSVSGSLSANSAVTVANGATLGGSGTINGTVTVNSAGIISLGSSGSTLTFANSTAPSYSTLTTNKIVVSGTSLDKISASATSGNSVVNVDLVIDTSSLGVPVSSTVIYSAGGVIAGPFHSVSFSSNPGNYTATLDYSTSGQIKLALTAAPTTYTVTYDANGGTGSQTDVNSPYNSGTQVTVLNTNTIAKANYTFSGWNTQANGGGTSYAVGSTFNIAANTTLYAQWIFNNATTGFNQTAAGPWNYTTATNWVNQTINGAWNSDLNLSAAQSVTFTNDTTLATGLTFNQSGNYALTLKASAAGTKNLTLGGDIGLNSAADVTLGDSANHLNVNLGGATRTLTVAASRTLTLSDVVSNGGITKSGSGTLTLSGANTYSGNTYINAGTVQTGTTAAAATNAFGAGTIYLGDISGAANATLLNSYWSSTAGVTNPIVVQAGSAGTLLIQNPASQGSYFSGFITLSNTLTLDGGNGSGAMFVVGGFTGARNVVVNCSTPGGSVQFKTGTSTNFSGTVQVVNGTFNNNGPSMLTSNNIVQVYAGATNWISGGVIAGLNDNAGAGGVVLNGFTQFGMRTLILGGSGTYSFNGVIQDNKTNTIVPGVPGLSLTMSGSGTQTLGGINTYSGATTISGGTLALSSSGSIANSTTISIAAGATFDVSAAGITLTGSSPQQTLEGRSTNGTATIIAPSKTVTLNSSALLAFQATGGSSSSLGKISVTGSSANLTLNNNAITVNVTGSALAVGTYRLLDCTGTLSGTANATPTITGVALTSGYTATVSTTTGAGGHVDLIVNAPPSFSGLAANPSITYGANNVSLSGTVSSSTGPTIVYPVNGDTVTAIINGQAVNGTVTDSTGDFTINYNDASLATLGVGSSPYTITYAYVGNAGVNLNAATNDTSTSLTVGKATPTATLAVNSSPVTYNGSAQPATVVTNFSSVPGTVGNVKYDGSATVPVTPGTYAVTADFIPNDAADYNTLSGLPAGNFVINPAATTITLTGTTFTYNGSAHSPSISISGSTGTLSTNYTGTTYSSANAPTNAGSYTLTVSVLGDGNFFGATNNLPFNINQASISVGASSTNNPSGYHDAVAFLATLPTDATGNVVFSSTNGPISTNVLSNGGAASVSITNLPRGTNVITVTYFGSGNYLSSTNTLDQVVTNHPPVATDATYYRAKGLSLKIALTNLLTYVTDVDGDTSSLQSVGAGLTNATIMADSTYVYYLPATGGGSNENDVVSYTVSDGFGGTATANILIDVYSATGPAQMSIPTNGVVNITFHGIPNYTYVVQTTTNLSVPWWTLSTNTASTNGAWEFTDPNATNSQQYYRAAQP